MKWFGNGPLKTTVRVTELPERDFDMGHWDDEVRDQTICSILEGKERVLGLRVEVLSRENEIVLVKRVCTA